VALTVASVVITSYGIFEIYRYFTAPCGKGDHISGKILPVSLQDSEYYRLDMGSEWSFPIIKKRLLEGFAVSSLPGIICGPFEDLAEPIDLVLKIIDDKIVISVT